MTARAHQTHPIPFLDTRIDAALKLYSSPYPEAEISAELHLHALGVAATERLTAKLVSSLEDAASGEDRPASERLLLRWIALYPTETSRAAIIGCVSRGLFAQREWAAELLATYGKEVAEMHAEWRRMHVDLDATVYQGGNGADQVIRGLQAFARLKPSRHLHKVRSLAKNTENDKLRRAALEALEAAAAGSVVPILVEILAENPVDPRGWSRFNREPILADLRARRAEAVAYLEAQARNGQRAQELVAFGILRELEQESEPAMHGPEAFDVPQSMKRMAAALP